MHPFSLNCKGQLYSFDRPLVMGILNLTPDSFYAASRLQDLDALCKKEEQMLHEGALFLDVGACSTRPGSLPPDDEEEIRRLIPALERLHKEFPDAILSADTFRSGVASLALEAGASMINDVSGLADEQMAAVVSAHRAPYVLMHTRGTPLTMQQNPEYTHAVKEVAHFFAEKSSQLRTKKVHDIILDPGIGFGKKPEHNRELLMAGKLFSALGFPTLIGVSRKSAVTKILANAAGEALNGSTVLHTLALLSGYAIIRTHDVKEAVEAISLTDFYMKGLSANFVTL
jgi:dihydropteroate synthase